MQKVRQRSPFQLPKAESTGSLCSAGDELKRKKIDCHFFRQQHLPASAAASGEIPCCLRKCPAELQGTQSTEEGLAPCVPVVWECSTFMELPARQPGSARSMKPTTISPGKKRGEKRSRNKAWLWNWKWRDVPGGRGRGVPDLARAEVQGMSGSWSGASRCTPWEEALARTTGKAQQTRSLEDWSKYFILRWKR